MQYFQPNRRARLADYTYASAELRECDTPCPGWTASVDDNPVALQFGLAFNQTEISLNVQTLVLCYRPRWVWPNLGICGAGLLVIIGVWRR